MGNILYSREAKERNEERLITYRKDARESTIERKREEERKRKRKSGRQYLLYGSI